MVYFFCRPTTCCAQLPYKNCAIWMKRCSIQNKPEAHHVRTEKCRQPACFYKKS